MEKQSLFEKIDSALFKQMDNIKSNSFFAKILDQLTLLDDDLRKVLNIVVIFSLLLFPILFIGAFVIKNQSAKESYAKKIEIIKIADSIGQTSQSVLGASRFVFSPMPLSTLQEFNNSIRPIAQSSGMNIAEIKLKGPDITDLASSITRSEVKLDFKGVTTEQITDFIAGISTRLKMKIDNINIVKNSKTNKLEGRLHLIHFSKVQNESSRE